MTKQDLVRLELRVRLPSRGTFAKLIHIRLSLIIEPGIDWPDIVPERAASLDNYTHEQVFATSVRKI